MEILQQIKESIMQFMGQNLAWGQAATKALVAIAGSLVLWLVFKRVAKVVYSRLEKYEFIKANHEVLDATRQALFYGLILATGMYLIQILGVHAVRKPFYAIMVLFFTAPAKSVIYMAVSYLEKKIAAKTETKMDDIFFELAKRFSGILMYVAAIIFAMDLIGINVMPIIAGASVLGVALGFAAKDTLSNFIAGVLLLIDRPFEIGDRIEVWTAPKGSSTWGDVVAIGLRATKIQTTDNITVVIPNNEIMTRDIINYTAGDNAIRVRINMGIAYDADIAKAKQIILEVADKADWIMKDPVPKVVVRTFGDSSVNLQTRVWISEARQRMNTISHITDKVKEAFNLNGIEIPFPRRDIIIRKETDL